MAETLCVRNLIILVNVNEENVLNEDGKTIKLLSELVGSRKEEDG